MEGETPQEADRLDRALTATEGAAEGLAALGLPGVSFVAWILAKVLAGRGDRTQELYGSMGQAFDSIRIEIDEDFVLSDEFEAFTEEILEKGARRRERSKRDYYGAAFANAATPGRPSESERLRLVDTLERLRLSHLWLLAALLNPPDDDDPVYSMPSSFRQEFETVYPDVNWAAIQLDWGDMEREGLLTGMPSGIGSSRADARNFRNRVTDQGRRFHQFVTLPRGDVTPPS